VMVTCAVCGEMVDNKWAAEKVEGWVVPRGSGGPNHVRHIKRLALFAHPACTDEAQGWGKATSLFDPE
jgi:hypothetical protein